MLTLEEGSMIGLINATTRGDRFGVHEHARGHGVDAHRLHQAGGFGPHMTTVLRGEGEARERSTRHMLRHRYLHFDGQALLDEPSLALIMHAGLDPVVMCCIAAPMDGPMTVLRDGRPLLTIEAPEETCDTLCLVVAHCGGIDVDLTRGQAIFVDVPEAVKGAISKHGAARLSDLVSHPVLDAWHMPVTGCSGPEETPYVSFDTPPFRKLSLREVIDGTAGPATS